MGRHRAGKHRPPAEKYLGVHRNNEYRGRHRTSFFGALFGIERRPVKRKNPYNYIT